MKHTYIPHKRQQGFSVMEMVIYGGILSIFVIILSNMFTSILETQLGSESTSAVVQDGRYILSRLSRDIGKSDGMLIPVQAGDTGGILQIQTAGIPATYQLTGGNLVMTDATGSYRLNSFATTVSSLEFDRYANPGGKPSVRITMTLDSVTQTTRGPESRTYVSMYSVR